MRFPYCKKRTGSSAVSSSEFDPKLLAWQVLSNANQGRISLMPLRPIEKFNTRGELIYECPCEGCSWSFQFAVDVGGMGEKAFPAQYAQHLMEAFADHVKESHPEHC
jgi:hypothetical protein